MFKKNLLLKTFIVLIIGFCLYYILGILNMGGFFTKKSPKAIIKKYHTELKIVVNKVKDGTWDAAAATNYLKQHKIDATVSTYHLEDSVIVFLSHCVTDNCEGFYFGTKLTKKFSNDAGSIIHVEPIVENWYSFLTN